MRYSVMEETLPKPEFAERIIEKFVSLQSNAFLVYGNTRDVYPVSGQRYVPLVDFFVESLIKPDRDDAPRIVLVYDPSTGDIVSQPFGQSARGKGHR